MTVLNSVMFELSILIDLDSQQCIDDNEIGNVEASERLSVVQRISAVKKRRVTRDNAYINWNFILSSVTEIERLWSVASNILSDNRKILTPMLFEALLYLRINRDF